MTVSLEPRPGRRASSRSARTRGAAFVEFALVVPLLAVLLIGAMEFGWAMYSYHFVASAANQAARYAMVRGADCTSFASACPATASDIQSYVRSLAPPGIAPAAIRATVTWTPDDTPGSDVSVTVDYSFGLSIPFLDLGPLAMQSTSELVISQ